MSKYTREEQIQIVQWAMNLTATIESEQAQIHTLENTQFDQKPLPPMKQEAQPIQPNYPKLDKYTFAQHIKTGNSIVNKLFTKKAIIAVIVLLIGGNILGGMFLTLTSVSNFLFNIGLSLQLVSSLIIPAYVVIAIIKYIEFRQKRKDYDAQLAKKPEYLAAVSEAERVAKVLQNENQKKLDEEYESAMVEYNATVETYNKGLTEFETKKKIELSILNQDLKSNINALNDLYVTTSLIPKNNRALNELIWMFDDMSTSEHDFERALDLLNANKQIATTDEIKAQMQNLTNITYQGFSEVLNGIDYSNYQLDEINNILGKVRRDINLGNIAATSQRIKMNKNIKSTNAKLDKLLK